MGTNEIISQIKKLPVEKRLQIIEETVKSIRQTESHHSLQKAAEALGEEYRTNTELTAFTTLDAEDFYEAR